MNEVSRYVVEPGIGQQTAVLMINLDVWESFTDQQRQVFDDLSEEFMVRQARAGLQETAAVREALRNHEEYPVEIHEGTDEQRRLWQSGYEGAERDFVAESARRNPAAEGLHARYMELLGEVEAEVSRNAYPWD